MLKLHLGGGKRFIPGFVHIDLADFPHVDHRHDVRRLPMIADGAAELVYASHVFEYFDRVEGAAVLAEWKRVLAPHGVLRLAVPDFEQLAAVYAKTHSLDSIIGPLYGRWMDNPNDEPIYHRTVYDFASLQRELERAGFTNVRRYEWRETIHKDHDDYSQSYLPHLDKEHGTLISLNVEATKP
jgi:predicted SAM-dependent methyltransferase